MGMITKLDRTGHSTLTQWDPKVPVQIKSAEEVFGELARTGHALADVSVPNESKTIKVFDPEATEILAIPALTGG